MTDDASRKAFEEWVQEDPERAFKPLTIWQASRTAALAESAKVMEEAERVLNRGLELAVLTLAFHGRDRGTNRLESTLDGLEELARKHETEARPAIAALATIRALKSGKGEGT